MVIFLDTSICITEMNCLPLWVHICLHEKWSFGKHQGVRITNSVKRSKEFISSPTFSSLSQYRRQGFLLGHNSDFFFQKGIKNKTGQCHYSYFPCFSLLRWEIKFTFRAKTKNTRSPNGHLVCRTLLLVIFVDTSLTYMSQFRW